MLDITLASAILRAVPESAQVLFIGDPDQLPSIGPGSVLSDLLKTSNVPRFRLTEIFRQEKESSIVAFAHEINKGLVPRILSPLCDPKAFSRGVDCLFIDSDEPTREQTKFIWKVSQVLGNLQEEKEAFLKVNNEWEGKIYRSDNGLALDALYRPKWTEEEVKAPVITIPDKFKHVDLLALKKATSKADQLRSLLTSVHPWSTLRYGLTAMDTLVRLYTQTINEWFGRPVEIQVLSPQIRGSLGTFKINEFLQRASNPESPEKKTALCRQQDLSGWGPGDSNQKQL